ncbi:hypothetical protein CW703_00155 [Candidatus Bathyarchaeota archaeon]|nr:MAG: hypothetical protein B6U77_01130 [Candidatus Hecatellales archaeon ex4484_218]RJX16498.1 MAG: hypothetical protein CW703_00155 [Candidatus Bathyarchaeota archaeon]
MDFSNLLLTFVYGIMPLITLAIMVIGVIFVFGKWFLPGTLTPTGGPIRIGRLPNGDYYINIEWFSWYRWFTGKDKPKPRKSWWHAVGYAIENLILDVLLFRRVFRRDKVTWALSWPMHISAGLIIFSGVHHAAHSYLLGISSEAPSVDGLVLPIPQFFRLPLTIPGLPFPPIVIHILGIIFLVEVVLLLIRRLTVKKVAAISKFDVVFDLVMLICGGVVGVTMGFIGPLPILVAIHGIIAHIYFICIPWTFYTHIIGGMPFSAIASGVRKARLGV